MSGAESSPPESPRPRPSPSSSGSQAGTLVFHLTASQRRRYRIGLAGAAAIVWVLGLVRLVVSGRVASSSGYLGLIVLALALVATAAAVGLVLPVVVVDGDGVRSRWGFRRSAVPWSSVTAIGVRERGEARRVVLDHEGGKTVLPVPLTGGSILSPGVDPALDHKVDLLRQWWQEHLGP